MFTQPHPRILRSEGDLRWQTSCFFASFPFSGICSIIKVTSVRMSRWLLSLSLILLIFLVAVLSGLLVVSTVPLWNSRHNPENIPSPWSMLLSCILVHSLSLFPAWECPNTVVGAHGVFGRSKMGTCASGRAGGVGPGHLSFLPYSRYSGNSAADCAKDH